MRAYSDAEIQSYVDSGDPLDKAGAYAIQDRGFHPAEDFAGCMASVMGMPLCHLERLLRRDRGICMDGLAINLPKEIRIYLSHHQPGHGWRGHWMNQSWRTDR